MWLAVPRLQRWTQVFADTGSGSYESAPFTVARKWRIRYRLYDDAEVSWKRDGDFFSDGSFFPKTDGALHAHTVTGDPGTFSITIRPYGDSAAWYVEVDALQ